MLQENAELETTTSDYGLSHSDDEHDEEEQEPSWFDDLRSSWLQHCVAIAVAVAATILAYCYQRMAVSPIVPLKLSRRTLLAPSTMEDFLRNNSHAHLNRYQRTANVSFCGMSSFPTRSSELAVMDFDVPHHLVPSLILHFQADWLQDDDIVDSAFGQSSTENYGHDEVRCLLHLKASSPRMYIKGITQYYKTPSFETMYSAQVDAKKSDSIKDRPPRIQAAILTFTGFAAKFVNMGSKPVLLFWDARGGGNRNRRLVGEIYPFEALSTATRPGESFSISPAYDHSHAMARWTVTAYDAVKYYEPGNSKPLTEAEDRLYKIQKLNQEFAKHYLIHAGRTWLSNFPRAFPVQHMWKAEYFGQRYNVPSIGEDQLENNSYLLEVVSVTPRMFQIQNFLSAEDCDKLIQLAVASGLKESMVYAGTVAKQQRDLSIRSSSNTWLARDTANITDEFYRRAAQVLKLDNSLLRAPIDDDVNAKFHSIAESLQVIHYKKGEEYAPHHDWAVPSQRHRYQPTRFATLLLYLNDDFQGGRTIFPRAVNSQHHEGIKIEPEKGTAILFYNLLPDGNVDELSQHGSEKVSFGDKVRYIEVEELLFFNLNSQDLFSSHSLWPIFGFGNLQ